MPSGGPHTAGEARAGPARYRRAEGEYWAQRRGGSRADALRVASGGVELPDAVYLVNVRMGDPLACLPPVGRRRMSKPNP